MQRGGQLSYATVGDDALEGIAAIVAGALARTISLVGLVLNALLGWWWADPAA